ncbi:hypothetical protein [Thiolapillus sp.]|uniref:hypothetical protein n=1 Tax=Thiolapillus sp. TaxID=2017437 RepID=UPI003AF4637D
MTRTAGAQIGCQRLSRFWGLGCPKIYHEAEDTLEIIMNYPFKTICCIISSPCHLCNLEYDKVELSYLCV